MHKYCWFHNTQNGGDMKEEIGHGELKQKLPRNLQRSDHFRTTTICGIFGMYRTVGFRNGHFLHQFLKQDPTLRASKLITNSLYFDTQNTVFWTCPWQRLIYSCHGPTPVHVLNMPTWCKNCKLYAYRYKATNINSLQRQCWKKCGIPKYTPGVDGFVVYAK